MSRGRVWLVELPCGDSVVLPIGFKLRHPTIEFLFDALVLVAVHFLNRADYQP